MFWDKCENTEYEDLYLAVKNCQSGEENEIFNQWRIKKSVKILGLKRIRFVF